MPVSSFTGGLVEFIMLRVPDSYAMPLQGFHTRSNGNPRGQSVPELVLRYFCRARLTGSGTKSGAAPGIYLLQSSYDR